MLRSLYTGVSGMKNFQVKMDVVSNNIANVNTTGFKAGKVSFQDMMSQLIGDAEAATPTGMGGSNIQQIGLGVRVGSIDTIMTGGALQTTNRDLDFAIEGEGFFAVSENSAGGNKAYTRDGMFYTDSAGNLVNSSGLRVLGYTPETADPNATPPSYVLGAGLGANAPTGNSVTDLALLEPLKIPDTIVVGVDNLELQSYTIDGTGQVIGVYSDGTTSESYLLGQVGIVTFNNPGGLEKTGGNTYIESKNSGIPEAGIAGSTGYGKIQQGFLEMSNVDLANEFTEMIITSRAYQANSRTITTSDEMLQELINLKR